MHGLGLRQMIENLETFIVEKGKPVVVDNQGTIEVLNHSFNITYNSIIDIEDIQKHMKDYYDVNGIDYSKIEELEKNEYSLIENELYSKFALFNDDIHSRRVLWSDDCCISLIHYLIRDKKIYCFVHLRSSDIVNKLFSDLFLIHKITRQLQDDLDIKDVNICVNGHSMHKLVLNNMNKCKNE
ncbi:MAG: hypothetical protein K0Q47_122 [Sedimentibacter sp.]|jgi:thymidylate synthase|nr:hypothetical protein [Sedimentibacter sp.]